MRKLFALAFILASCVEPYATPEINEDFTPLVVDGYVDLDGSASVKLSRAVPLSGSDTPPKVSGADVTIESSSGETFQLHEDTLGTYTANNLHVDTKSTYQLHIVTESNDYRSGDVQIYSTPPVDSVYWKVNVATNKLELMLDSHDDNTDGPGLYLASGLETYEYHAPEVSNFIFIRKLAVRRTAADIINVCWRTATGPGVLVNTNKLSKRVMSGLVISTIDPHSEKLSVRYSVLARLRAVSPDEYEFQRRLIQNEQTGTLFSSIPGPITGNIISIKDSRATVLGYFRGQQMRTLRYFIPNQLSTTNPLPVEFITQPPSNCQVLQTCIYGVKPVSPCTQIVDLPDNTIITETMIVDLKVVALFFTTPECGDCRVKGGTTTRPPFW